MDLVAFYRYKPALELTTLLNYLNLTIYSNILIL